MSNALKYADALLVRVELRLEGASLSVCVDDDGKGFDLNKKKKESACKPSCKEPKPSVQLCSWMLIPDKVRIWQ